MVAEEEILTRGGIYLARLDPVKDAEVGKIRPVAVLTAQAFLNIKPPVLFICPLSSQSKIEFDSLHIKLQARDNLEITSYLLVEHCRSITYKRIIFPRLAQLTTTEIHLIIYKLQRLIGHS